MAKVSLSVEGITCGGCEKSIRNALLARDGVSEVIASHKTGVVEVEFDESQIQRAQLKEAIVDAGFEVAA